MNAKVNQHEFADKLTLADQLARDIAGKLDAAIKARGKASIAVSGGGTPKLMFAVLAEQEIDWSKVTITLVDERWVDESSDRSNARLVKQQLRSLRAKGHGSLDHSALLLAVEDLAAAAPAVV